MRKRSFVVSVRLNIQELRYMDMQVSNSGLSRETFLRKLIAGTTIKSKPCSHHPAMLRQVSGLCSNINQAVRLANGNAGISRGELQELKKLTEQVWEYVRDW